MELHKGAIMELADQGQREFYGGIVDDLGELAPYVRDELIAGIQAETHLAELEQRKIAEANSRLEAAMVDGVGQHMLSVDAGLYAWWAMREPGCWSDKDFRRRIARDNPSVRVKSLKKTMAQGVTFPKIEVAA